MNKNAHPTIAFSEALAFWLKLGFISFGGPAGQIAIMHRVVVDEKKGVEEQRFLHALNFCVLLPGPAAQKPATYLGWPLHRVRLRPPPPPSFRRPAPPPSPPLSPPSP